MKSKEAYWETVDKWWDYIVEMASDHFDLDSPAFEKPGNPESPMTGRTVLEEMNSLKRLRSEKLPRYFQAIWGLASDAYARERRRGWDQLCDLCSEEYLIYEGNDPQSGGAEK